MINKEKTYRVLQYSPRGNGKLTAECMKILASAIKQNALKIELVDATCEREAERRGMKFAAEICDKKGTEFDGYMARSCAIFIRKAIKGLR